MESLFRDYEVIVRSGLFDPTHYVAAYPDVAKRNIDPLLHYLEEGASACRNPHADFNTEFYLAQCKQHGHEPQNPLLHYITVGFGLGLKTKPDPETQSSGAPPMRLYLDEVAVGRRGILRVDGWVVCLVPVVSVEVFLDDISLGAAEIGRLRTDVEETQSDYPNARFAGFLLVTDVSRFGAGAKTVSVRATAQTGIAREHAQPVEVPALAALPPTEMALRYHCDHVSLTTSGRVSVAGWAVGSLPTTSIHILIDGKRVGDAQSGIERGDVGNLFPTLPHARLSGFAASHASGPTAAGEHLITVQCHSGDDRVEEIVLPVLAVEAEAEPEVAITGSQLRAGRELTLDTPALLDGAMETPVRGNLEISGWALARAGVAAIEIAVDDVMLTTADYGARRLDVQSAFPDWDGALDSGFAALLPHRLLPQGPHKVTVTLRDNANGTTRIDFRILVEPLPDDAGPWALRRKMAVAEIDLGCRLLAHQGWQPTFQVLLAIPAGADLRDACTTVASLRLQAYPEWRLAVLRDPADGAADPAYERLTAELDKLGEKCRLAPVFTADELAGEASFLTVLTPGSELGCDAFHEMALATAVKRDADFLYSDERRLNPGSGEVDAFFKPQWSPDLLLATNYVGQLWCARGDLVRAIAAAEENLFAQGGYDLVLRCTERAAAIQHVPFVLCERRSGAGDEADQDRSALDHALRRRQIDAEILPGLLPGTYRCKRALAGDGLVSIIIPTRATQGMIERCIETIRRLTTYRNFEIVCIENIPAVDAHWRDWLKINADRVVSTEEPFNWSRFNNQAASAARGEFLVFLNDDTEIVDPDWLSVLLGQAQRAEVGVVGPMLLYPDGRIQHAGMFLAAMAQARHAFRYLAADEPGYFGLARTERNVMAVTGACLLTRREVFDRLGGFDEAHDIVNNDIDYCLRVWQAGLSTVYTPHTRLIHYEAVSRSSLADDFDAASFDNKWRDVFLRGDPFFSPHLSKAKDDVAPDDEPNRVLVVGGPALPRRDIKKILALKLDHIGDCIIAFPAVRRLKQHFPEAQITVLTSRASRSVWQMEPAVDATIAFDFFHARSSEGQVELSDENWRDLEQRLIPEQFDLAIDLRKHLETRPVLQHTGARYCAGVDYRSKFPWLDVSVEWSGDPAYTHKRHHSIDDLVNLVDAVAAACETDRQLIVPRFAGASATVDQLVASAEGRRLVCIHPTAGNVMKEWPIEYFAAVADQLVEDDDAQIVLIGGPGDETAGAALLQQMRRGDAAISLIGRLPLAELPALLVKCALFLGNDSGPKHIAAGLGVPTVAVHSGTVDVYEWGPVGPQAVAVSRDVACAPCYLPKLQDCRRGLACLKRLAPQTVYAACRRLLLAGKAETAAA